MGGMVYIWEVNRGWWPVGQWPVIKWSISYYRFASNFDKNRFIYLFKFNYFDHANWCTFWSLINCSENTSHIVIVSSLERFFPQVYRPGATYRWAVCTIREREHTWQTCLLVYYEFWRKFISFIEKSINRFLIQKIRCFWSKYYVPNFDHFQVINTPYVQFEYGRILITKCLDQKTVISVLRIWSYVLIINFDQKCRYVLIKKSKSFFSN